MILFGSRARGEHGAGSDVDILIVCRDTTTAADSKARRAIKEYFAQHPPRLGVDIVTLTQESFDYCRRAPNHVAGQAMRDGIVMSGERLDQRYNHDDEYPDSWPDVKERLQATYRNLRGFATTFEHNREDQETWATHGQQALENSLKAWASAAAVRYRKVHELDDVIDGLLIHPVESQTLAAQQLVLFKDYTTYEDARPGHQGEMVDWLVLYATKYKYSGTSYRMSEDEQQEFSREVLITSQTFINRAHELTGTEPQDLQ